ncbi:MAG: hypothetical protein WCO63_06085 [Bacteroidota bacterium]
MTVFPSQPPFVKLPVFRRLSVFLMLSLFVLAFSGLCKAQDSVSLTPWYFDDGGISKAKNMVTIDLWQTFRGEYAITYERRYWKYLGTEISAGLLSKQYHFYSPIGIFDTEWYNTDFHPASTGWSLGIAEKIYFSEDHSGVFWLLSARHLQFQEAQTNDFAMGGGYQFVIGNRFAVELGASIGIRYQKSLNLTSHILVDYDDKLIPIVPLTIKIGYLY